ncbi:MAG: UvrD-helicase domain-containing protein, partial [Muribaculaceae bacterium]|nr:UvrD-helicase domain-containing protein [Muribaculaceae bacterium]
MSDGVINIIKASAGSGKTYNLARIYVANLLGTPTGNKVMINNQECDEFELRKGDFNYHRHLLAITFTNKATNEMKERIIKELHLVSQGKGKFLEDFKIMFKYKDINEVVEAAKEALKSILFDYGNFNVSTIDSFFQSILRNFARELDRDYNYDLQIDSDYATSVAVHDFLLELGKNNAKQAAINDWVKKFIEDNINNKKDWDFFGKTDDLKDFAGIMYKEFFHKRHADVINYLSDIGNGVQASKITTFRREIASAHKYHKDQFSKSIVELRDFFDKHNIPGKDIKGNLVVNQIYQGLINDLGGGEGTFRSYALANDSLSKKVLNKPSKDNVTEADEKDFKDLVIKILHHLDQSRFFGDVLNNIWNLGLLGKINEKLEEYRKDTNTILIADTNTLIGEALKSGAYFIYEHVGNRYKTYMIDEFQDTSEKQYRNFVPLIEESLGNNNSNLVIGDEKQSIYRFRNSDPSLLRDVIEENFLGRTNVSSLDTNYRSFTSIVEFNNGLFEKIIAEYDKSPSKAKYKSLIKTYSTITQTADKKETGYVTVNFVPNVGSIKQKIFRALPAYIASILSRGYKMSDIAILVSMKSEGREIIDNIMRYNESLKGEDASRRINVISTESLLLVNSPSVKLVLSVLRFLEITQYRLPEDNDDSLDKDFNKFLERRVSEQRFFKILHDFEAGVQNADVSADAGELLHKLIEQDYSDSADLTSKELFDKYFDLSQELMPDKHAQLSNLVNIVDKIIAKYILINNDHKNRELENSYLLAFVDVVHGFASKHNGGTIREFLQFWDDNPENFTIGSSGSL